MSFFSNEKKWHKKTSFYRKMQVIPRNMLNDIFTDAIIQNVKKTKLIKTMELILERKIKW